MDSLAIVHPCMPMLDVEGRCIGGRELDARECPLNMRTQDRALRLTIQPASGRHLQ